MALVYRPPLVIGGDGCPQNLQSTDALGGVDFGRTVRGDAAYTVLASDRYVAFTALTATRNVTLPPASAFPTGRALTIVDEVGTCSATVALNILAAGSDKINGAASAVLAYPYAFIAVQSDGSGKWTIVDQSSLGMAQQAPGAVAITGGSVNGTAIGATTPAAGAFTTLSASGAASFPGGATSTQFTTSGSGGQFAAVDRTTSGFAVLYRNNGVNRLFDSTYGDTITWNSSGQVTLPSLTLGSNPTATDSSQLVPSTSWVGTNFMRAAVGSAKASYRAPGVDLVSIPNGDFNDGLAGWSVQNSDANCSSVIDSSASLTGPNSLLMTVSKSGSVTQVNSSLFPVTEGMPLVVTPRMGVVSGSPTCIVQVAFFDKTKATLSSNAFTNVTVSVSGSALTDYPQVFIPPAGTRHAQVNVNNYTAVGVIRLDEVRLSRATALAIPGGSPALRYARAAEERATDIVSVMEYIPPALRAGIVAKTNTTDLTTYINNAIADAPNGVWFPAGDYFVNGQINGAAYKRVVGAGVALTRFIVKSTFNMSARAVFYAAQYGGCDGIGFDFDQSSATSRSTLVQYPWAMDLSSATRFEIGHVRICKGYNGINADQAPLGSAGAGFRAQTIEMGCFNYGLYIDHDYDFTHIDVVNAWCWDFSGNTPATFSQTLYNIYSDGNGIALVVNEADGLEIGRVTTLCQKVIIGNAPTDAATRHINVVELDSDGAVIDISGPTLNIDCLTTTKSSAPTVPSVINRAGVTNIGIIRTWGQEQAPQVQTLGGVLVVGGGYMQQTNTGFASAQTNGGVLVLNNVYFDIPTSAKRTVPYIQQGTGYLVMRGCTTNPRTTSGSNAGSGAVCSVNNDQPGNSISGNDFGGWLFNPPGAIGAGTYGPNGQGWNAFTPIFNFVGPGNFVPTYTVQSGRFFLDQDGYWIEARIVFNTNAYSTSGSNAPSGYAYIAGSSAGPLYPRGNLAIDTGNMALDWSMVTLTAGNTKLGATMSDNDSRIFIRQSGSAIASSFCGIGNFPPSTNNIELIVSGYVMTRS